MQVEEEIRIEKLGKSCLTSKDRKYLRDKGIRFSKNIVIQCHQKRKSQLRKSVNGAESKFVYRYHNIYKNLIRDIKIHFREKFDTFKSDLKQEFKDEIDLNFNYPLGEAMF